MTGYQEHLTELTSRSQRPAVFDVYSVLGQDTCFALPGNQKPERRRKRSRETISLKKTSPRVPRTASLRVDHIWKQKETTVWLDHTSTCSLKILCFPVTVSCIHNNKYYYTVLSFWPTPDFLLQSVIKCIRATWSWSWYLSGSGFPKYIIPLILCCYVTFLSSVVISSI